MLKLLLVFICLFNTASYCMLPKSRLLMSLGKRIYTHALRTAGTSSGDKNSDSTFNPANTQYNLVSELYRKIDMQKIVSGNQHYLLDTQEKRITTLERKVNTLLGNIEEDTILQAKQQLGCLLADINKSIYMGIDAIFFKFNTDGRNTTICLYNHHTTNSPQILVSNIHDITIHTHGYFLCDATQEIFIKKLKVLARVLIKFNTLGLTLDIHELNSTAQENNWYCRIKRSK